VPINLPEKSASKADDGNILKRRLLGAAVLIALAVILLPLVLDGSGSESRFRRVEQLRVEPPRILDHKGQPEVAKPSVKPAPTPTNDPAKPVAKPVEQSKSVVPEKRVEEPAVPAAPATPDPETRPAQTLSDEVTNMVAWVVQAGSFADESNALALRDKLRTASFPAFISPDAVNRVYRVKVGPITDRKQANKVQNQVESMFRVKTLVRQYR